MLLGGQLKTGFGGQWKTGLGVQRTRAWVGKGNGPGRALENGVGLENPVPKGPLLSQQKTLSHEEGSDILNFHFFEEGSDIPNFHFSRKGRTYQISLFQ